MLPLAFSYKPNHRIYADSCTLFTHITDDTPDQGRVNVQRMSFAPGKETESVAQ